MNRNQLTEIIAADNATNPNLPRAVERGGKRRKPPLHGEDAREDQKRPERAVRQHLQRRNMGQERVE
jgi:hypothetical protein